MDECKPLVPTMNSAHLYKHSLTLEGNHAGTSYAVLVGGADWDGAQRGTVTIPVLAPYENHPDQQLRSQLLPHCKFMWATVY